MDKIKHSLDGTNQEAQKRFDELLKKLGIEENTQSEDDDE